jgi:peptidoglycan hydrolase-like protein with peptidoglycan-binding domain
MVIMALSWFAWRNNNRIQRAQNNNPAMRTGEKGEPVHLLQASLILNGFDVPSHGVGENGVRNDNYGQQTQAAVREAEDLDNLSIKDSGVAGKQVITDLDTDSAAFYGTHAGHVGAGLARQDAPRAISKVQRAITGASALLGVLQPTPAAPVVTAADIEALRVHFRLLMPGATIGSAVARTATAADLTQIRSTFQRILSVLASGSTAFTDGVPFTGVKNPAESVPNSRVILFGPFFRDFDAPFGDRIGNESRAAILIHEGMHSVDISLISGRNDIHISEFSPAYDVQRAELALLNPSSYASFAAHVFLGSDPVPRFGLGPVSRGL